jgi:hypothetical protein
MICFCNTCIGFHIAMSSTQSSSKPRWRKSEPQWSYLSKPKVGNFRETIPTNDLKGRRARGSISMFSEMKGRFLICYEKCKCCPHLAPTLAGQPGYLGESAAISGTNFISNFQQAITYSGQRSCDHPPGPLTFSHPPPPPG